MAAATAPHSANSGTGSTSRFRSATEHDVYADNRDENIFGWIQPDEWDTVAGINKNNFLRGDCVECVADQDKSDFPSTLQSCGGPSCGYGAQCCEYSRRAAHARGPVQLDSTLLQQRSTDAAGASKIADLAKKEQKSSLGVSLIDIIHGRSCRPISLLDLRTFLHFQRQPSKRLASYYPASDMQSSALDDVDLNLDLSAAPSNLEKRKRTSQRLHYDEVDALDFLVAYERYVTKFRDQPRVDRLKSPNPSTCKAAVRAVVRRQCRGRVSHDLTAMDVLLNGEDDMDDIPEDMSRQVLARLRPADLGLRPETQPLRVEFDRIVHRYLCSRRACILPSSRKPFIRRKRNSASSSDTASGADSPSDRLGTTNSDKLPRLRWMVDVGLISESDLQLSLAECDYSTHPDVLAPIADAVYTYMSQHVTPFFFISVARNLSPNTKRGRLLVGVVCTAIALAFSILLIVTPSPLAPRAAHGTGHVLRWWRLLTAPVWCAGLGYILAYFTGLCVWLTLRGNREPDEEEEREREEIRSRISGEDVVGFDLAELQAAADERDMDAEHDTSRWMAPEIAEILTGITGGNRKDKHKKQRSSSEVSRRGDLEEAQPHSKPEIRESTISTRASFEHAANDKFTEASSFNGSPASVAAPFLIEKDSALTMPAAVIMHTPRRALGTEASVASRLAGSPSALELAQSGSVRPSLDMSGGSSNEVRAADATMASSHSSTGTATMKQKRVPLLNFSIGMVRSPANEIVEEHADGPVLTRDALLFDPELAARVGSPTFGAVASDAAAGRAPSKPSGSPHSSPPGVTRRKSLVPALLPLKSSGRLQAQTADADMSSPTRESHAETDVELALPSLPEPAAQLSSAEKLESKSALDPREVAPWSAPVPAGANARYSSRPVLFALPSGRRKSRHSATTSTTAVVTPLPATPTTPKRTYDASASASLRKRLWTAVQRGTGFAVGTEHVLDARVRRAQQMKALRIMALNTLATVVVMVIVLVIP